MVRTSTTMGFTDLPVNVVARIFAFVPDVDSLACVTCVSRTLHAVSTSHPHIWEFWNNEHWGIQGNHSATTFLQQQASWGRYRAHYRRVSAAISTIRQKFADNFGTEETVAASLVAPPVPPLRSGLSEAEIDNLQAQLHCTFPDDLRLSFRLTRGQGYPAGTDMADDEQYAEEALGANPDNHAFCVLLQDISDPQALFPIDRMRPLIRVGRRIGSLPVYFNLRTNQFVFSKHDTFHVTRLRTIPGEQAASSWTEFLEHSARHLRSLGLPGWDRFVFGSETTTVFSGGAGPSDSVKISVHSTFLGKLSLEEKRFFVYRINISRPQGARSIVQLKSRLWVIHEPSADGVFIRRVVQGPGVIGETPVFGPGDAFEYCSYCPTNYDPAAMEGYFVFTDLNSGRKFKADIRPFFMDVRGCGTPFEVEHGIPAGTEIEDPVW